MRFDSLVLLDDPEPHPAALNMAIDEVLLRATTVPLLRCYRWLRPAVSFGYFGNYAEVASAWLGCEIVRRWTGGGIVPHGEDFTYSLLVPKGCAFAEVRTADSYRAIHEVLAHLLERSGVGVSLSPLAATKVSDACFENAARHDLVSAEKKIAGAAQRRTKWGLLHQGSIQISDLPPDFGSQLAGALAPHFTERKLGTADLETALSLAAAKYAAEEWTARV